MIYAPTARDLSRMHGLHPHLVATIDLAYQTSPIDIMVVQGVRTVEEAYENFGKGRTAAQCLAGGCPAKYAQPTLAKVTWLGHALSSNHLPKPDGFGHAVDLSPVPYAPTITPAYTTIAHTMKAAALKLGIGLAWGGDWTSTKDYPHFELTGS